MVVLAPLKPVAIVLGLLSALIFVSYFGSALIHGRDPFAVNAGSWPHAAAQHVTNRAPAAHKSGPKHPAETTQ